jgi:ABC-type amino acid transport substrate-binding protein
MPKRSTRGVLFFAVLVLVGVVCGPPWREARGASNGTVAADLAGLLDPEEKEWLVRHSVVRVSGPRAFAPFHFFDEQGRAQGMAFDYLRLLLSKLGLEMRVDSDLAWPEVLRKAENKDLDLVACAARTSDREAYLRFSAPVLSYPLVIIGRKDGPFLGGLDDLRGLRVAFVRGNVVFDWLQRDHVDTIPHLVATPLDALRAVSVGQAEAHIENLAAATYLMEKHGLTNLKVAAPTTFQQYDLHFAVRADWPELAVLLDKALRTLSPREHAEIRNTWLAVRYEYGIRPVDIAQWGLAVGIPIAAALGGLVFGYARLRREVAHRLKTEAALRRAKEAADAASRAKSEFLANMSHEIRTPINGVMGMLQVLQATDLDAEQAAFTTSAIQSCARLERLLSDILDFSRIEAGKLVIQMAGP